MATSSMPPRWAGLRVQACLAWACVLVWAVLLGLATLIPMLAESDTMGDDLTRSTVRVALLFWCFAAALLLWRNRDHLARSCWTLAWLTYLVHLAMAFHFYHHWSHADAVAHTEAVSGFGWGILFSHLFTILWSADVCAWWLAAGWHARRAPWIDWALHAYMAFIIFNGTVVYEPGFIRWAGLAMFGFLGGVFLLRRLAKRR